jgi:hypothetical protein
MHIREIITFTGGNTKEMMEALAKWREMLEDEMTREVIIKIRKTSDEKMLKIMEMMTIRMRYINDIDHVIQFNSKLLKKTQ